MTLIIITYTVYITPSLSISGNPFLSLFFSLPFFAHVSVFFYFHLLFLVPPLHRITPAQARPFSLFDLCKFCACFLSIFAFAWNDFGTIVKCWRFIGEPTSDFGRGMNHGISRTECEVWCFPHGHWRASQWDFELLPRRRYVRRVAQIYEFGRCPDARPRFSGEARGLGSGTGCSLWLEIPAIGASSPPSVRCCVLYKAGRTHHCCWAAKLPPFILFKTLFCPFSLSWICGRNNLG